MRPWPISNKDLRGCSTFFSSVSGFESQLWRSRTGLLRQYCLVLELTAYTLSSPIALELTYHSRAHGLALELTISLFSAQSRSPHRLVLILRGDLVLAPTTSLLCSAKLALLFMASLPSSTHFREGLRSQRQRPRPPARYPTGSSPDPQCD